MWPRLLTAAKSLLPLLALLAVAATDVKAGEPMLLAFAKPSSPQIFNATHVWPKVEAVKAESPKPVAAPKPATNITVMETVAPQDNAALPRENFLVAARPVNVVSLQAGYGKLWRDDSILEKISAGHQEPGCAYVKAKFSF